MRKLIASTIALAFGTSVGMAGGLNEPAVEAVEVVEEDTSKAGFIVPLLALAAAIALVSANGDSEPEPVPEPEPTPMPENGG